MSIGDVARFAPYATWDGSITCSRGSASVASALPTGCSTAGNALLSKVAHKARAQKVSVMIQLRFDSIRFDLGSGTPAGSAAPTVAARVPPVLNPA